MFLIYYDNGESYEDHDTTNLCVVPTETRATELIAEWLKWVEEKKQNKPVYPEGEPTEAEYETWLAKEEGFRKTLKPPYGFDSLVSLVYDEFGYGSLRYQNIKALA